MPGHRLFCLCGVAALYGCALLDEERAAGRAAAEDEIGRLPPPPRRTVSGQEAGGALRRIAARLQAPARAVCAEIGAATCDWHVEDSRDREVNAFAASGGRIVVHRGVVEAARNDEEVAFVVAHEMAHQAANHVADARQYRQVGAAAGAMALGVLGLAGVAAGLPPSFAVRNLETGAALGPRIGRLAFSQEQEREADYLAALILHRAGYDLGLARGFLVTMGRISPRTESGLFDNPPGAAGAAGRLRRDGAADPGRGRAAAGAGVAGGAGPVSG